MKQNLSWVNREIKNLKKKSLIINFRTIDSPTSARIKIDGKWYLNFSSNNYLGLANDKRLIKGAKDALDNFGVGPAAVRTIAGTSKLHLELEKSLAKFKKTEAVITYQSGFTANLAVIPALTKEGDLIFSDELNHASIIDACKLTKAKVIRYNHLDTKDLENKIKSNQLTNINKRLIVTDGVFSMDGDIAPMPDIVKVAKKYGSITLVDDAHGEGVLGKNGRGIVDHFKLHGQVDIEIGTLSKAFGVVGGLAAGNKKIIEFLKQRSRPFLFSSAMTFPDIGAAIEAVKILSKSGALVEKLWKNSEYFKSRMKALGFDTGNSQTPITPIMLGEEKLTKSLASKLYEKGIFVTPITYPTVALGSARIRVMVSAAHSKKDFDRALGVFEDVGKSLKII